MERKSHTRLEPYLGLRVGVKWFSLLWAFLLISVCGCTREHAALSNQDSINAQGAVLDKKLTDAYLHRDWATLSSFIAPDYYASGGGFEWNRTDLEREFPKIHLQDFHVERQRVKQLAPDALLVTDVATVHETYAGQDISGRLMSSDVWVQRDGKWFLLVEQEVPLK